MRLFKCLICGNLVELINDGGGTLVCCGQEMEEQIVNPNETVFEKHIPVITKEGNKVKVQVGSTIHPMTEEHYIEWITLVDEKGSCKKVLAPNDQPIAEFETDSEHFTVYAYCNIHGFYKAEY